MSETSPPYQPVADESPATEVTRSPAGGWSGTGYPEHGDFVLVRPVDSTTHIVQTATPYNSRHARVVLACGAAWSSVVLDPSDGDLRGQCDRCWEVF